MLEKIAKFMNCHKGKSMYIRGYDVQVYGLSTTPTMNVHEGTRVIFQIRYSNGKYWLFYAKEDIPYEVAYDGIPINNDLSNIREEVAQALKTILS